jgi:hypothetical protein
MPFDDDIFDDLFHGCAFAAFMERSHVLQGWPDSDSVRRRAYSMYEESLAEKNGSEAESTPEARADAAS